MLLDPVNSCGEATLTHLTAPLDHRGIVPVPPACGVAQSNISGATTLGGTGVTGGNVVVTRMRSQATVKVGGVRQEDITLS